MKTLKSFTIASAFAFMVSSAFAGDFKIIANPSVEATDISADELKGVFLMTKTSIRGASHVEPVLLSGGAAHESLLRELQKSDNALKTYYRSLVFTGKGSMPKFLGTDAEVQAYVAKTKGAIGYVSASAETAGVKTLEIK